MSDLSDLYQEVILDHNRAPRNFGRMEPADHTAQGYNPLCGDRVQVYLKMDGDRIQEIAFDGSGCAISTASASVLTEILEGKTLEEAENLFRSFVELVTGGGPSTGGADLGKLQVFARVREYPTRVKCATLVWHTLRAALEDRPTTVSTE